MLMKIELKEVENVKNVEQYIDRVDEMIRKEREKEIISKC